MLMEKINEILALVESRDVELYEHLERTALYSFALAKKLELSAHEMETVYYAGLLHDIGKLSAVYPQGKNPVDFAPLVPWVDEKQLHSVHPLLGYYMIAFVPGLEEVADVIKHHHERFDGMGFPFRLLDIEIPLLTRILTVADAYDKIRLGDRSFEDAIQRLRDAAGSQFDPALVEPLAQVLQEEELS